MALAGLGMSGSHTAQSVERLSEATRPVQDYKATKTESQREVPGRDYGRTFDPLAALYHDAGMSPKEYGLRYGNGGSKRSNRLRYSHNAKLKRRA